MDQLSYLTCTGGQAQELNEKNPHGFVSLNQVLQDRASSHPDLLIAGFPETDDNGHSWNVVSFTFSSLSEASNVAASYYVRNGLLHAPDAENSQIIALLSPSCAYFLVTVFAAFRLGYGVLLLAPQINAEAINYLCRATKSTHLICHPSLIKQGYAALSTCEVARKVNGSDIVIIEMAPRSAWREVTSMPLNPALEPSQERNRTALVFHTSGSTGMPKPIYHSHRVWTEGLPCLPGDTAFTTTPLFHGGMPDFLRSMMALSPLYLYSSLYPITTANVVQAVAACPGVRAFLSVPYILKMLSESEDGIHMLQNMNLVSTGGAPLLEETGDRMVAQGINLVSRLGSSECGFLMSSHRHYETDKAWSWLRNNSRGLKLLTFEPSGDSQSYELVVSKEWPTLCVANRPDGSFATGDLYHKHPTLSNTWHYAGRADDVIVLVNGEKVSASPIENSLRASPNISEVLVFGTSKHALGVLILPATAAASRHSIIEMVHCVNGKSPTYAHIMDEMVVILSPASAFPKSSKGSLLRPQAYRQYAQVIAGAYESLGPGKNGHGEDCDLRGDQLVEYVRNAVKEALPDDTAEWSNDDDLFVLGISSLKSIRLRHQLQQLLSSTLTFLSYNVVFENPSVNKLVTHIEDIRSGTARAVAKDQYALMRELVAHYGTFVTEPPLTNAPVVMSAEDAKTIILTGATGALGAHIMATILHESDYEIVALVRARNDSHAETRVIESLRSRGFSGFDSGSVWARVTCLATHLEDHDLGLHPDVYAALKTRTRVIIHAAWAVNFVGGLESFAKVHLRGTRNLIDLAISSQTRAAFVFCSSTAAVVDDYAEGAAILETVPQCARSASPLGYSRSKWVAEHICANAHAGPLNGRISVARIGQLCGDTENGIWKETEGWPLLIASLQHTGCLPALQEQPSWLPVDIAAKAILDVANTPRSQGQCQQIPVYHIVNTNTETSWDDILSYLAKTDLTFAKVTPEKWLQRLESPNTDTEYNPSHALLALWKETYGHESQRRKSEVLFDTSAASSISRSMRNLPAVSSDLIMKFVRSWRDKGVLPPASPS